MSGIITGMILFLLYISNSFSYLSDSPETCMNCHVMGPQYATWYHSAHRENATCNDCHVPQDNIFHTWYFKAMDGMRHSAIFTLRQEPQAIIIKEAGAKAVQKNCIRCHGKVHEGLHAMKNNSLNSNHGMGRNCWECHQEVPHGKVRSLSSTPFAKVPTTKSIVPKWLKKLIQDENGKEN
jgi:cytochrome c nitrite reductase small subunit